MSAEDEAVEDAKRKAAAMHDMAQLISESDGRISPALLMEIAAEMDDYVRILGEARDLIKENKRQKWPTDEWKVSWASRRERLELEREQNEGRMKGLMGDLVKAMATGPSETMGPEESARYHEIIGRMGITHGEVRAGSKDRAKWLR